MSRIVLGLALALAVAGCATTREAGRGSCDAGPAQVLIGALGTGDMAKLALRRSHAKSLRWIHPGMAVTMDYRADRLNIEIDERDFIRSIRCG